MDDAITPSVLLLGGILFAVYFAHLSTCIPFAVCCVIAVLGARELGDVLQGDEGVGF